MIVLNNYFTYQLSWWHRYCDILFINNCDTIYLVLVSSRWISVMGLSRFNCDVPNTHALPPIHTPTHALPPVHTHSCTPTHPPPHTCTPTHPPPHSCITRWQWHSLTLLQSSTISLCRDSPPTPSCKPRPRTAHHTPCWLDQPTSSWTTTSLLKWVHIWPSSGCLWLKGL